MENILSCENVGYRKRKISKTILDELRPVFSSQNQQPRTVPLPKPEKNIPLIVTINPEENNSKEKQEPSKNEEIPETFNEPIYKFNINKSDRAILNIGGTRFEIQWDLLEKHPQTRLGQLRTALLQMENDLRVNEGMDEEKIKEHVKNYEFWFDCHSSSFEAILDFYRKGKLHLEDGVCPVDFADDLQYWGLDESNISACCLLKFQKRREYAMEEIGRCEKFYQRLKDEENYQNTDGRVRHFLWNAFEKPTHWQSQVTFFISTLFILLSTFLLIVSTIPEWQLDPCRFLSANITNTTICRETFLLYQDLFIPSHYNLPILEEIFIGWFTIEYLLRLYISRDKRKFFCSWLNTIDLVSILPFYITVALKQVDVNLPFLQCLLVFRVLRIFKLARYCTGLYSLGVTLRRSSNELGVLLLFMSVASLVFSSLVYIAEKENPDDFHSIPDSVWWSVITMTTVGYGDVVPKTSFGKVVGMLAAITGVLIIALPVATITSNFSLSYEDKKQRESVLKLKYEQMKMQKKITKTASKSNFAS